MRVSTEPLRNTVAMRVKDDLLDWIDAHRGTESRSTFVRKSLEREARRDLQGDGDGGLSTALGD